jgi:hypothetical protein
MYYLYIRPESYDVRQSPAALHVLAWGCQKNVSVNHNSARIRLKLDKILSNLGGDWFKYYSDLVWTFQPAPAEKDSKLMAIYESRSKYDLERRTIGKPAKMLRKIIPVISESDANEFAIWWNETFCVSESDYEIQESSEESAFLQAYKGGQSKTLDPTLNCEHESFGTKSLQASCMRHEFDNLPKHPAAAYASGDFKIVWAQDRQGKIAGRAVVSIAKGGVLRDRARAGAIYTTSDKVSALIANHLTGSGCIPESNWAGSHMQRIEYDGCFVLPYVDGLRTLSDHGVYLVFDRHGDLEANQTSGLVETTEKTACDCCGDRYDSDSEGAYVDDYGSVCQSCLDNNFTYYECEYYHSNDCVEVYSYNRYYGTTSETVPQQFVSNSCQYVMTADSEYWNLDDCIFSESLGEFYPSQSGDIFYSEIDSEYYCITERVTYDGQAMTKDQAQALENEKQGELDLDLPIKDSDEPLDLTPEFAQVAA